MMNFQKPLCSGIHTAAIVARGEAPSPAWTPARSIEELDRSGTATLCSIALAAQRGIS
jgi:hypothetical protein